MSKKISLITQKAGIELSRQWRSPFQIQELSWRKLGENEIPSEDCNWFWPIGCSWIILGDKASEAQVVMGEEKREDT